MQLEEQQARTAHVFDVVAGGYDREALRFFPFSADCMIESLRPLPGWRLLDVATGTGVAALSAARLIAPKGRVQGIDISAGMLDQAFANVQRAGLNNIDLQEMDAMELTFRNDYFDALMCSFGIFFFPDMQQALRGWQRVMKPGAPIVLTTFAEDAFQPLMDNFLGHLQGEIPDLGLDALQHVATQQACEELLSAASYENIEVSEKNMGYHLRNVDEWWEVLWHTALRGLLMQLPADALARLRSRHLEEIKQHEVKDGLWLNVNVLFSRAECPARDG
ncbi:class I SAM-dependent methyltransferase [Sulfuriflexus mobilis]|uniref:class I SAM-dependent methyltransferase n=1 Tax=Sulfuriflexus mobilis TaxID=1811807 RepID=UPI000F82ED1C|nr:class I SAM-dependent methyltransferase [Sulfuriflexus mobilis]